ncbi:MAG TPA: hypothetical protein VIS27_08270 [Yeosuana sp.]
MEFFKTLNLKTTEQQIQKYLTLSNLSEISNEIFNLNEPNDTEANIGGIWGEFTLTRNEIRGGIRFALAECPNALCWTITAGFPPDAESVIIHLTINQKERNQDFIEEIEEFLEDMGECLTHFYKG